MQPYQHNPLYISCGGRVDERQGVKFIIYETQIYTDLHRLMVCCLLVSSQRILLVWLCVLCVLCGALLHGLYISTAMATADSTQQYLRFKPRTNLQGWLPPCRPDGLRWQGIVQMPGRRQQFDIHR